MDAIVSALQRPIAKTDQVLTIKMTHTAGQTTADDPPVLHAAIGLAQQIRAASDGIERGCRILPSIAAAMKDAGVFGMAIPRIWGGPELDPLTQFRVIEALAMADGSVDHESVCGRDAAKPMRSPVACCSVSNRSAGSSEQTTISFPCVRPR